MKKHPRSKSFFYSSAAVLSLMLWSGMHKVKIQQALRVAQRSPLYRWHILHCILRRQWINQLWH